VEGVGRETGAGVLKGWFGDLRAVLAPQAPVLEQDFG